MFPGNHPEPNLVLRLFYKAGEEKNGVFLDGVGEKNCKVLSFVICVSTQKWYHMKAEMLNFNIKQKNYKSVHYSQRYGLKCRAGPKKSVVFLCFAPSSFLLNQQKIR